MLDFTLTPEQLDLQQKAREFAKKEILPVAWYYDEIDETPMPLLKKAYDAGLINGDIPHQYGGMGWGLIESVVMTEEFAAACLGSRQCDGSDNFSIHCQILLHRNSA